MEKPRPLKPGDSIGVIAPASPPDPVALSSGCEYLERQGYRVVRGRSCSGGFRSYLSATDEIRRADFLEMFRDPDLDAIFCARGGYGSLRILPLELPQSPKIFLGFSDITTLHLLLNEKMPTFHGPMVASSFAELDSFTETNLWQMLTYPKLGLLPHPETLPKPLSIRAGKAEGVLTGGNLSLVAASLGTKYEIETEGKILLLEEVEEPTYKVDRMLRQLSLAGKLKAARGILFGYSPTIHPQGEFFALLKELAQLEIPVLYGLAFGHGSPKLTVPLGVEAQLDAGSAELSLLESPFN